MPFDLQPLTPAPTVRIPLVHPDTKEPTDAVVILHGPHTAVAREIFLAQADDEMAADGHPTLARTLAAQDDQVKRLLVGVEGLTFGETVITAATLPDYFTDFYWIPRQVYGKYAEIGGFFAEPKASSSPSPATSESSTP